VQACLIFLHWTLAVMLDSCITMLAGRLESSEGPGNAFFSYGHAQNSAREPSGFC